MIELKRGNDCGQRQQRKHEAELCQENISPPLKALLGRAIQVKEWEFLIKKGSSSAYFEAAH